MHALYNTVLFDMRLAQLVEPTLGRQHRPSVKYGVKEDQILPLQ